MSESHSSASSIESGPLTGHRVRYDGLDAVCGSVENGMYRIRFERSGHSLLVTPSFALEDLGVAVLYIDQPAQRSVLKTVERLCQGEDHGVGPVRAVFPVILPPELRRCPTCKSAAVERQQKRVAAYEVEQKAAQKARRIPSSRREPRPDRSAFSKAYGPLNSW